jgi:hypothetical protein
MKILIDKNNVIAPNDLRKLIKADFPHYMEEMFVAIYSGYLAGFELEMFHAGAVGVGAQTFSSPIGLIKRFHEEAPAVKTNSKPAHHWHNNAIQFPRLISEINANFRLNGEELNEMLESMAITSAQLDELFNRADATWEAFKAVPTTILNSKCSSFNIKPIDGVGTTYKGIVDNNTETGLAISIDGYSDNLSDDHNGAPIYLRDIDNDLSVVIYGDINQEDPTDVISLKNARIGNRSPK